MKVCLPEKFDIFYPKENKAYYTNANAKILRKILSSASDSYCMYCGVSLRIDGKENFHLEHSVDKEGNYNQPKKNTIFTKINLLNLLFVNMNVPIDARSCVMKYVVHTRK